jgi:hypothetical protein
MTNNKTSGDGITEELKSKCDADNQFGRFDRVFRQVVSVPKAAIDKEDAKQKRLKAKKKKARS